MTVFAVIGATGYESYSLLGEPFPNINVREQPKEAMVFLPHQEVRFPALAEYTETIRRPLFFANRRLPVIVDKLQLASPTQMQRSEADPTRMRLKGVLVIGQVAHGLIEGQDKKWGWYSRGDHVQGWKVFDIQSDHAVLSSGNRSETLWLYPLPAGR